MLVSDLINDLALNAYNPVKSQVTEPMWMSFINSAVRDARNSGWMLPQHNAENVELLSQVFEYDVPSGFAFVQSIRWGDRTNSTADTTDTGTDLDGALSDTTGKTVTVDNNDLFVVNDLIQVDDEIMLVTAVSATIETLTVTRGYFSSTAATHSDNASVLRPNADVTYDTEIPQAYWEPKLDSGGSGGAGATSGSRPMIVFNARLFTFTAGTPLQFVGQKRPTIYTEITETVDGHMESFLLERALYRGASFMAVGGGEGARALLDRSRDALALSEQFLGRAPAEFRVRPHSRRIPGR